TDGRVSRAGGVEKERCLAVGRVEPAPGVAQKLRCASCRVLVCSVEKERPCTNGSIETGGRVAFEREITSGCIVCANGEAQKSVLPFSRIASGITAVRWWANRLSLW